jgi:hypothetical protein
MKLKNSFLTLGLLTHGLVYNYFIWSMIQLLHYIENAQENKKNTILSYNIAENSKWIKRNEEKVCVWMLDGVWLVH